MRMHPVSGSCQSAQKRPPNSLLTLDKNMVADAVQVQDCMSYFGRFGGSYYV